MSDITVVEVDVPGEQGPGGVPASGLVTDATTARTLALTDAQKLIEMTSGSANTVTVPPNSSVEFPLLTQIGIAQAGAGKTTIAPGVGVTVKTRHALSLAGQEAVATLIKVATDTWRFVGDTEDVA